MSAVLTCPECADAVPAERLADADGERLFGCCACGMAFVEHDFASEVAVPSSRYGADWRDISLGENVVSFSCG